MAGRSTCRGLSRLGRVPLNRPATLSGQASGHRGGRTSLGAWPAASRLRSVRDHRITAGCERQVAVGNARRIVGVPDVVQDRDEQQPHRLAEVKQPPAGRARRPRRAGQPDHRDVLVVRQLGLREATRPRRCHVDDQRTVPETATGGAVGARCRCRELPDARVAQDPDCPFGPALARAASRHGDLGISDRGEVSCPPACSRDPGGWDIDRTPSSTQRCRASAHPVVVSAHRVRAQCQYY